MSITSALNLQPCFYCTAPVNVNCHDWVTSCEDCSKPQCSACLLKLNLEFKCADCRIVVINSEAEEHRKRVAELDAEIANVLRMTAEPHVSGRKRRQKQLDDEVLAMAARGRGLRTKELLRPLIEFISDVLDTTNRHYAPLKRRASDARFAVIELVTRPGGAWGEGTMQHRRKVSLFVSLCQFNPPYVVADYCKVFAATWRECKKKKALM